MICLFHFIKRNAKAFSLNATVDVHRRRLLRRHKMIFLNISETVRASNHKICDNIYHDSLYIWTGNDVITTSSRKKIVQKCKFWVMFGSRFLDNCSTDTERFYSFGNCDSSAPFLLLQSVRHFCSLAPKMGLKWAYRRLRITQMADFDLL